MFGLDPNIDAHKKVICEGCMKCVGDKVVVPQKVRDKPNYERKGPRVCQQPWHHGNGEHREDRKTKRRDDFLALFNQESEEPVDADINKNNNSTPPPPKRRQVQQQQQNDAVQEDSHAETQEDLQAPPLPTIFDEEGHFTNDALKEMKTQLLSSYQNANNPPNENDMRVAGMLMNWIFKHCSDEGSDVPVAKLLSFPCYRPIIVAKVPETYDAEETARLKRNRTKKANDWIETLLKGNFDTTDVLVELLNKKRKKTVARKYIVKEWNKNHRFSVETTLSALKYAGINPTQLEKLSQFIDVETREPGCHSGLRLFAPRKCLYRRKKQNVKTRYPSMKFTKCRLEAYVTKKKKKKEEAKRTIQCSVGTVRLDEVLFANITDNRSNGRFVPASKRYSEPVQWVGETALYKISTDGGAGSNKHGINPVNVKNPQGQEHFHPVLEYSGAKDDYNNLKKVYEAHPEIKRSIEDICNRRIVLLEVKIGNRTGSCMAVNTNDKHDYKCPSRLPDLSDSLCESSSPQLPKSQPVDKYSARFDFAQVKRTRLIHNERLNCYEGLVFEDNDGNKLGTSSFSAPLSGTSEICQLNQVLVMGVFSSDLALLCTIFGHQGAKAMWFCLFCLMKQCDAKKDFDGTAGQVQQRTLKMLVDDGLTYCEAINAATQMDKSKTKFKPTLTQTETHSVTDVPLLDIPLDCVTYATMHVVLGITKWLVDVTISGYEYIEGKAAGHSRSRGGTNNDGAVFRATLEHTIKRLHKYEEFVADQVKDAQAAVVSHNELLAKVATLIEELGAIRESKEDVSVTLTTEAAAEVNAREQQIEEQLESLREQVSSSSNDEDDYIVKYLQMVLEQRCITKETIQECEEYLKDHSSHANREFVAAMKMNGVDQTTYFQGSLVGNHCMTLGEKSDGIYSEAAKRLEPLIGTTDELKRELHAFTARMKTIVGSWFKLMRVMKSVGKQSQETIDQFRQQTETLRDEIFKLIKTDVPIKGWKKRLTRSMKAHLLFGEHLLKQLLTWGTLGGIDEQNIETCHAIWNKLLRQFGATRGHELQQKVLSEYLFQTSPFLHCDIARVKKETKSTRKKNASGGARTTSRRSEESSSATTIVNELVDNNIILGALATSINGEEALHPELAQSDDVVIDIDSVAAADPANNNRNNESEKVKREDTMIKICTHPGCGKMRLAMAFHIHQFESHKVVATNSGGDEDGGEN